MAAKRSSHKALRVTAIVLAALLVLLGIFTLVSHVVYHRSAMATAAELLFRFQGTKSKFSDPIQCAQYIESRRNAAEYTLTQRLTSNVSEITVDGARVYTLSSGSVPDYTVLYLHGGAYINDASVYHWKLCDSLVQKMNARVIFPIYPLTPVHTWDETFELVTDVYRGILEDLENQEERKTPLILMGDSAGGGLAVAMCEYFKTLDLRQPDRMILFSPWMDVSMSNPDAASYESVDPMLSAYGLIEMGRCWAGDLDIQDWRISPIFGDLSCLDQVYLFVGTREIFYPDVVRFHDLLKAQGSVTELYVGEGMNHVYPLYPIPEADDAMNIICSIMRQSMP